MRHRTSAPEGEGGGEKRTPVNRGGEEVRRQMRIMYIMIIWNLAEYHKIYSIGLIKISFFSGPRWIWYIDKNVHKMESIDLFGNHRRLRTRLGRKWVKNCERPLRMLRNRLLVQKQIFDATNIIWWRFPP